MDGQEEATPPANIQRARTLPPELDLPVESRETRRRGLTVFSNGLRHHHSDESDYRLRHPLLEGGAAPGSAYTSLRDLLPSPSAPSPTAASAWPPHEGEISIRNRLVKQAAYAYLQPMAVAVSPGSSARARGFFSLLCWGEDGCAGFLQVLGGLFARLRRKGVDHGR